MILGWIDEAVRDGAAKQKACEVVGISRRTLQRWRRQGIGDDNRAGPRKKPKNVNARCSHVPRSLEAMAIVGFGRKLLQTAQQFRQEKSRLSLWAVNRPTPMG